jgi:hypothetical protein
MIAKLSSSHSKQETPFFQIRCFSSKHFTSKSIQKIVLNLNWFDGAKFYWMPTKNEPDQEKTRKDYAVYNTSMKAEVNDST